MTKRLENSEPVSLSECLHDGIMESLKSDPMARMLTIEVDSSFHWDFHKLSTETRFKIVGEYVRHRRGVRVGTVAWRHRTGAGHARG